MLDLERPVEELKLLGSPRVAETDKDFYEVYLPLSRELTAGEAYAAAAHVSPAKGPAGGVRVASDRKHLVIRDTTIEKIAEHRDSFREIVSKIATEGEEYRKSAVEAQRSATDEKSAREAERERRREAAKKVKFD